MVALILAMSSASEEKQILAQNTKIFNKKGKVLLLEWSVV